MKQDRKAQRGFALVEALIVLVVVAVGLLALARFEGDLMSGSGLTKARDEALMLARDRLEELTNTIRKDQYLTNVVNTGVNVFSSAESITGRNAVFLRDWQIEDYDNAAADDFKEVIVRVRWTDAKAGAQSVLMNSQLAFKDPGSPGVLGEEGGAPPGTRGMNPKRSGKKGPAMEEGATLTGSPTVLTGIPDIPANSFQWQFNTKGNIVLLDSSNRVLYTFFGQSLQWISGRVYYDEADFVDGSGRAEIIMFASEPAYCAQFPIGTDTCPAAGRRPTQCGVVGGYVCFFSGDCEHGGDGCTTFNPNGAQDFEDIRDLDGGWYGKVGIAGVAATSPIKTICQADVDDDGQTKTPAREYVAVRTLGDGSKKYEGINQSFDYQNFVIARLTDPLNHCSAMVNDFSWTPPDVGLPASKVRRYLGANTDNAAQGLNNFWGSSVNIVAKVDPQNWDVDRRIGNASASGAGSGWPEDECVVWPEGKGFSCSVPHNWTGFLDSNNNSLFDGSISLTVVNNTAQAQCTTVINNMSVVSPIPQSRRLSPDVTLCTP